MSRRAFVASAGAAALAAPASAGVGPDVPGIRIRPDREEMVPVPGGRAYVRVNGDLKGPRAPIVLLHGGPGSSHWYFLGATALASERAVILYDQLDSGRSDSPDDPANWHIGRFVAELEAIGAHLGIERWHVLGASWGGTIALNYGAKRPKALASLILQSPLISTLAWLHDANILKAAMPADMRRALDSGDGPAREAATEAFYRAHVHLSDPPPDIAAYKAAMPRTFSDGIYNHMWGRAEFVATGTLKDYDGTALLARLDGPRTLFVAGSRDEARPETVAGFARRVPGARFAEIPHAAHTILIDNPEAYLALLRGWCAGHDAA